MLPCRQVLQALSAAGLVLALASCASPARLEECTTLLNQANPADGVARLQQVLRQDPQSGSCQRAYAIALDRAVDVQLRQAERLRLDGQLDDAARVYRSVLEAQPGNDVARQGLRRLETLSLNRSLLAEARRVLQARDWAQARGLIETVLRTDSSNTDAQTLMTEISRQAASPVSTDQGLAEVFKKPASLEFKDASLRQVFEVFSKNSDLNFVFDKDVRTDAKVSIFLRDTNVESALYYLLLTNQLAYQAMNSNTLLIYPNSTGKQKDYQELNVRSFQMANTDVKAVAAAIKTLFKGRDFVVDEKLNMLVVRDTPEAIRLVEKLVALHDVAEPEVMLEVAILEVSRKRLLNLGVKLPDTLTLTPLSSGAAGLTLDDLRNINRSSIGAAVPDITISAKKDDTDVNILANPRIRVVNREKAKVLIGERVPVITVTTSPTGGFAETVNYVEVGLKLDVEPVIYRGNDIVIKIGLEVSNISGQTLSKLGGIAYTFGTRTANTTLRLRDGENQVLAGLINDEDRKVASKVPGLGDMPMVGRLFGTAQEDGNKTEIMLSITPRLVRNVYRAEGNLQEFSSGTETSMRERPEALSAGRPVIAAPRLASPATVPVPAGRAAPVPLLASPLPALPNPVPAAVAPRLPAAQPPAPPYRPAPSPTLPAIVPNGPVTSAGLAGKAMTIRVD